MPLPTRSLRRSEIQMELPRTDGASSMVASAPSRSATASRRSSRPAATGGSTGSAAPTTPASPSRRSPARPSSPPSLTASATKKSIVCRRNQHSPKHLCLGHGLIIVLYIFSNKLFDEDDKTQYDGCTYRQKSTAWLAKPITHRIKIHDGWLRSPQWHDPLVWLSGRPSRLPSVSTFALANGLDAPEL